MPLPAGVFIELPTPASVEIASLAGWDFVVIDTEHGAIAPALLPDMLRAARVPAIVRVSSSHTDLLQLALDAGAAGILVPRIHSVDQAAGVLAGCRFHPAGRRGLNGFVRAAGYSLTPLPEFLTAATRVRLILQIETLPALEAVERIAALPGLDELFIGPFDLSQALGVPGQVQHPDLMAAGRRIIAAAHAHGREVSVFCNTLESAAAWAALGVDRWCYSADVFELAQSLRRTRQQLAEL